MAYFKGERVEVWSDSKKQWLEATVDEAYVRACFVDGYDIHAGTLKVTYVHTQQFKYITPDMLEKFVKKRGCPVQPADREGGCPADVGTCKWKCGFRVQRGMTKGANKFDTCCKKCAQLEGKGMRDAGLHDENCDARSAERRGRNSTLSLGLLQNVKANMEKLLASPNLETLINAALTASPPGDGPFNKQAIQLILDRISKQHQIECYAFGLDEGATVARSGLQKKIVEFLRASYDRFFPDVLKISTQSFVQKNSRPLAQVYKLKEPPVGKGSFGTVYLVEHYISHEKRVAKRIEKSRVTDPNEHRIIMQEIHNMAMLDHPNIIKVYEYFDDPDFVSQIMEPCDGGELQDRIDAVFRHRTAAFYGDNFIRSVMKQALRALAFMHSKPFAHKDLKPQNIMMVSKESSSLKVIDFGLAELFKEKTDTAKSIGGTLLYMSPQTLQGKMQLKCDIWSMGVILYNLISGGMPFCGTWPPPPGKDAAWWERETSKIILDCPMKPMTRDRTSAVSGNCLNLLDSMLEKNDRLRLDATACLNLPWFTTTAAEIPTLSVGIVQCLECFSRLPQLKKIIFLVMAHQSAVPALEELREIFTHFDTSNEGMLRIDDLRLVLSQAITRPLYVDKIAHALDVDGNGKISWTEFLAGALCIKFCKATELVHAAFAHFDSDGDGQISAKDLEKGLFYSGGVGTSAMNEGRERFNQIRPGLLQDFRNPDVITREQFHKYISADLEIQSGDQFFAV